MLVIRKKQIETLQLSAYDDFAVEMLPVARASWETDLSEKTDEEVKAQLRRAAVKSAGYNIHSYKYIMRVFGIFMVCGEDFDTRSRYADVTALLKRDLSPEKKFRNIDRILSVHLTKE